MKIKKVLERDWTWEEGNEHQKDLYIKTLERVIIEQENKINLLESQVNKVMKGQYFHDF